MTLTVSVLSSTLFDDGLCGNHSSPFFGTCHSSFQIPINAQIGSIWTIFWLWDFTGKLGPIHPPHIEVFAPQLFTIATNSF